MTRFAVVIPSRYASTRFPAKPLHVIAGKTMLARVCENALAAAELFSEPVTVCVATDHEDIKAEAERAGVRAVMSSKPCATGSDRVTDACERMQTPISITKVHTA